MRYPRTIVFVDLSGFTAYIGRTDDDAAIAMLKTFRETARDLASEVGVRIDKHLGDGLMAIATDQNSGVIFAMELQRRFGEQREELNLRIGIASGDIILFQGEDYIGTAPNLAARLCDEAARYGILMPTYQAINLPDGVIAEPHYHVIGNKRAGKPLGVTFAQCLEQIQRLFAILGDRPSLNLYANRKPNRDG